MIRRILARFRCPECNILFGSTPNCATCAQHDADMQTYSF